MKQGIFMRKMEVESKEQVIDVVGVIGWEVWFPVMRDMLKAIPDTVERVIFDIYSPGGDVWEGNAIIQEIGAMKQETVARVQVAASMATLIAVACKTREIASNGRWLIHNPWTELAGDATAMEKRAKELRDCEIEAAEFYAKRTGKKVEEMTALMAEERWLTPAEAKEFGFVQAINDPFDVASFKSVRAEITAAGKWPKALAELPEDEPKAEEFNCSCVDCGATITSDQHCNTLKCEKCGGQMRRAERPGPGKEKQEDNKDDNANTKGAKGAVNPPADESVKPADGPAAVVAPVPVAVAPAKTEAERAKEITSFVDQLADRDALIAKHQSAKDKAEARIKEMEQLHGVAVVELTATHDAKIVELTKLSDESIAKLQAEIADVNKCLKDANDCNSKLLGGSMAFQPTPFDTWEEALQACGGDHAEAAKKHDPNMKLRKAYNEKHKRN